MRTKGGRKRVKSKLQRRLQAVNEATHTEFGDGRRMWFQTVGHNKSVCYRRPGSNK